MKPVQYWRLAVVSVFWTLLAISFFVDLSSAAPGPAQDANSDTANTNLLNRRGMRALREMRNLRRSHRSKFPLRAEEARRKSKRTSGKHAKSFNHKLFFTFKSFLPISPIIYHDIIFIIFEKKYLPCHQRKGFSPYLN